MFLVYIFIILDVYFPPYVKSSYNFNMHILEGTVVFQLLWHAAFYFDSMSRFPCDWCNSVVSMQLDFVTSGLSLMSLCIGYEALRHSQLSKIVSLYFPLCCK